MVYQTFLAIGLGLGYLAARRTVPHFPLEGINNDNELHQHLAQGHLPAYTPQAPAPPILDDSLNGLHRRLAKGYLNSDGLFI